MSDGPRLAADEELAAPRRILASIAGSRGRRLVVRYWRVRDRMKRAVRPRAPA